MTPDAAKRRRFWTKVVRRGAQIGVVLWLIAIPLVSQYASDHRVHYPQEVVTEHRGDVLSRLGPAIGLLVNWVGDTGQERKAVLDLYKGGIFSASIHGVDLTDPFAALSHTVATWSLVPAVWLGAALPLLLFLALGRVFCGYLCPYGILTRALARPRRWLNRRGIGGRVELSPRTSAALLVVWLAMAAFGVQLIAWIAPYLVVSRELFLLGFFGTLGVGVWWLLSLLLIDLFVGPHIVCRSLCPSGTLQGGLGRWRLLRLRRVERIKCETSCDACEESCWLGLNPRTGRLDGRCDGCGRCVDVCPVGAIKLGTIDRGRRRHAIETAAGILFALLLLPAGNARGADLPEIVPDPSPWENRFLPPADRFYWGAGSLDAVQTARSGDFQLSLAVASDGAERDLNHLRLFIQHERSGEAYTGGLSLRVSEPGGSVDRAVELESPNQPRGTPNKALYQVALRAHRGVEHELTVASEAFPTVSIGFIPGQLHDPGRGRRSGAWIALATLLVCIAVGTRFADKRPA